jgi:hypothetical protein
VSQLTTKKRGGSGRKLGIFLLLLVVATEEKQSDAIDGVACSGWNLERLSSQDAAGLIDGAVEDPAASLSFLLLCVVDKEQRERERRGCSATAHSLWLWEVDGRLEASITPDSWPASIGCPVQTRIT